MTGDPAFLLTSISKDQTSAILRKENIDTEKPIIGICVSSETALYHYKQGETEFLKLFARTIDSLANRLDAQIVLIPFSTWEGHGGDDRIISRKIISLTEEKQKVKLVEGEYGPRELKGIISCCKMFIGARGHSCILALSSSVPTIAIGHNPKYHGIMKMVKQENYVCKAQQLTYDRLALLISQLWTNQENVKKELQSQAERIQGLARFNAELVKKILGRVRS